MATTRDIQYESDVNGNPTFIKPRLRIRNLLQTISTAKFGTY